MGKRLNRIVAELVHSLKVFVVCVVITLFIGAMATVVAITTPTTTYTEDHIAVSDSADGETLVVSFEVTYTASGEHDADQRQSAMTEMGIAASCANEEITQIVTDHTADEVSHNPLHNALQSCNTENVNIELEMIQRSNDGHVNMTGVEVAE